MPSVIIRTGILRGRADAFLLWTTVEGRELPPPQRPRPVARLRGLDGCAGAPEHARPRAARRWPRLPPLLGRRAPRRRHDRGQQPRGPDRPDRVGDALAA